MLELKHATMEMQQAETDALLHALSKMDISAQEGQQQAGILELTALQVSTQILPKLFASQDVGTAKEPVQKNETTMIHPAAMADQALERLNQGTSALAVP